jgi:hypothetical protein
MQAAEAAEAAQDILQEQGGPSMVQTAVQLVTLVVELLVMTTHILEQQVH